DDDRFPLPIPEAAMEIARLFRVVNHGGGPVRKQTADAADDPEDRMKSAAADVGAEESPEQRRARLTGEDEREHRENVRVVLPAVHDFRPALANQRCELEQAAQRVTIARHAEIGNADAAVFERLAKFTAGIEADDGDGIAIRRLQHEVRQQSLRAAAVESDGDIHGFARTFARHHLLLHRLSRRSAPEPMRTSGAKPMSTAASARSRFDRRGFPPDRYADASM